MPQIALRWIEMVSQKRSAINEKDSLLIFYQSCRKTPGFHYGMAKVFYEMNDYAVIMVPVLSFSAFFAASMEVIIAVLEGFFVTNPMEATILGSIAFSPNS